MADAETVSAVGAPNHHIFAIAAGVAAQASREHAMAWAFIRISWEKKTWQIGECDKLAIHTGPAELVMSNTVHFASHLSSTPSNDSMHAPTPKQKV